MNRFLITGANGQVGFELCRSLALHGEVIAVTRKDCDLAEPDAIRKLVSQVKPTAIINPAAYTAVDKAESEPALVNALNLTVPAVFAECARDCGATFVHYSTDYVFDGSGSHARSETEPTAPINQYGKSKRDGEQALLAVMAGTGVDHYVLRTSWVFGLYGNNFIKTMLRLAQQRDALSVVGDQIGAPTSAGLLADLTALLLARRPESGIYHATAAEQVSWHGFAQHIIRRASQKGLSMRLDAEKIEWLTTAQYPTPAARPHNSRLDSQKLCKALSISLPSWTLAADQVVDVLVQNRNFRLNEK